MNRRRLVTCLILAGTFFLIWPVPHSSLQYSKALYSRNGELLAAVTSEDQQWCFPLENDIPEPLAIAIKEYEDAYLSWHPGVNPISVFKAYILNKKKGKIVRGASTLAMQVMRMRKRNYARTWFNKILEALSAVKYSLITSDERIIRDWAEMAPFGSNIIGVKAASLKYFGRSLEQLSWPEYALLAVLPNNPGFVNLQSHTEVILKKRNDLLKKLGQHGYISSTDVPVFMDEDLPKHFSPLPQHGYHLLQYLIKSYPQKHIFRTYIQEDLQKKTENIVQQEAIVNGYDDIKNLAAIIVDLEKNEVVAYQGNIRLSNKEFDYVDIIQAPRSYGSLLKPILYAYVLNNKHILPGEIVPDIPTHIDDFHPKNFDEKFRGAVRIEEMVSQSLNIPAVRILNEAGLQPFYEHLVSFQLRHLNKGAQHYGLSLILGGGEISMWDIVKMYKGLARNLHGYSQPYNDMKLIEDEIASSSKDDFSYSLFAIKNTVETMSDLTRPREEKYSHLLDSQEKIAWKTGTSYGHRDAWSVGFNSRYAVGVWVGNSDGEGRFNLTGISKAAPVMFKIFKTLPVHSSTNLPRPSMRQEWIEVCAESGRLAGLMCKNKKKLSVDYSASQYKTCDFHTIVYTDSSGLSIHKNCQNDYSRKDTFFVLPTMMDYYYRISHPQYRGLPSPSPECGQVNSELTIIYPFEGMKIFLPRETSYKINPLICMAHHRDKDAILFWYLNGQFIAKTVNNSHEITLNPQKGLHILTITDHQGRKDKVLFEILGKGKE